MISPDILEDDPSILDSEFLYRSIPKVHIDINNNNNVTSAAFKSKPHISVDRSTLTTKEETLKRHPWHVGVAQLLAGNVRSLSLEVASTPRKENSAHAEILRDPSLGGSAWNRKAKSLASFCALYMEP